MDSRTMFVLFALVGGCMIAGLIFFALTRCSHTSQWQPLIKDDETLSDTLTAISKKYNQPALAAALIRSDEITVKAAIGTCVYGEDIPVTINSLFI